jgi:hypothetical protein
MCYASTSVPLLSVLVRVARRNVLAKNRVVKLGLKHLINQRLEIGLLGVPAAGLGALGVERRVCLPQMEAGAV